jgi:hypothetical protein
VAGAVSTFQRDFFGMRVAHDAVRGGRLCSLENIMPTSTLLYGGGAAVALAGLWALRR